MNALSFIDEKPPVFGKSNHLLCYTYNRYIFYRVYLVEVFNRSQYSCLANAKWQGVYYERSGEACKKRKDYNYVLYSSL